MDDFRWSMKPVFISYLLDQGAEKVLYLDCDMFLFQDPSFLFKKLDTADILLTPHWKIDDPLVDKASFLSLFTSGIFTAGFVAPAKKACLPCSGGPMPVIL